jgi:hypothetical protein
MTHGNTPVLFQLPVETTLAGLRADQFNHSVCLPTAHLEKGKNPPMAALTADTWPFPWLVE